MNLERINDYIDAWAQVVNVDKQYAAIVKELIPKLIDKYSSIYDNITLEQDNYDKYPIKSKGEKYPIEDFFLNRLLRNVWKFDLGSLYKGDYTPDSLCVSFNEEKIKSQLSKFINKDRKDFTELDLIARKKVIMHEFKKAMQTRFEISSLDLRYRETYKKIIENIKLIKNGKYSHEVHSYEYLRDKDYFGEKESYISTGLHYSETVKGIKTYRDVDGFDNLNEIFNETESLEMAEAVKQTYRVYDNKYYYEIRNMESSNFEITNYGNLIKILLGDSMTFESMYLDANKGFIYFNDEYGDIFKKYFNNDKDAVENLIIQINKIKIDKDLNDHLLLQKVLSECMLKKVKNNIGKISSESLKKELIEFKSHSIWGTNKENREELEHYHILVEARDLIKKNIDEQKSKKV